MRTSLENNQAAFALRGAIALCWGLLFLLSPAWSALALTWTFASFAVLDGAIALVQGLDRENRAAYGWLLFAEGAVGIVAGVVTLLFPGPAIVAFTVVVAAWAIIFGVARMVMAYEVRKEVTGEWILALQGLTSVLLGVVLIARPVAGALSLIWTLGVYAVVSGIAMLGLALRTRLRNARSSLLHRRPSHV